MFDLPTLQSLTERARRSFRANLKGSDAWVWPNNIYASAKVIAGQVFEAFGFASYIEKSIFAHTAPDYDALARHGTEYNIPQKPAAPAGGKVEFTATDDLVVSTNAVLRRADNIEYLVTAGGVLTASGMLSVPVKSVGDGKDKNSEAGTPLQIISGVTSTSGTAPTAEVSSDAIVFGSEVEDLESWRQRILFRKRNPIMGGAAADYVTWAGQVAGVSFVQDRPTVYVERLWAGNGTVRAFPLMFDLYDDGIPSAADVARVREHISALQPAGARVTIAAPVAIPVNVTVSGLEPNTTEVQEAVLSELKDTFRRLSRPSGTDAVFGSMPYLATPFKFSVSWVWQAVANATGEQRHKINAPTVDVALLPGEMAVLGTVTFEA
jgi:uncharacterized phage protein gp47/JayE